MLDCLYEVLAARWSACQTLRQVRRLDRRLRADAGVPAELMARLDDDVIVEPLIALRRR